MWRLLQEAGIPVGVYGSLFSNAEPDLNPYAFFVPDVFSPHSQVNPPKLHDFQDFNLQMTRASGRNADDKVSSGGSRVIARRTGRICSPVHRGREWLASSLTRGSNVSACHVVGTSRPSCTQTCLRRC